MSTHKDHADVKVHPPILTMAFIMAAYLLYWLRPILLPLPLVQWLGLGLVAGGFLFGVAAFMAFRKARTTLSPHGKVSAIVTDGVYRYSRNPIYLGFLLMLVGFPLNSGNIWGVILAPLFVLAMNRLVIEKEEAYLEKKFRETYAGYRSRVRRWL